MRVSRTKAGVVDVQGDEDGTLRVSVARWMRLEDGSGAVAQGAGAAGGGGGGESCRGGGEGASRAGGISCEGTATVYFNVDSSTVVYVRYSTA